MSLIVRLNPNQVFVFGSNSTGFHGAGSAGLACRGDARNTWRDDEWFLTAMKSPVGSPARIGRWAIYGQARGFQIGRTGKSYAIETIIKPGLKRSLPLIEIEKQIVDLIEWAKQNPQYEILYTAVGAGLAGYSGAEMEQVLKNALAKGPKPANLIIPPNVYKNID